MRKVFLFAAAIGCVAVISSVANAQCGDLGVDCLDDGGLRLATPETQTSNSDWTLDVNFPDGVGAAAQFQGGFADADNVANSGGTGVWFKSFEGEQEMGDLPANASISQDVMVPTAGDYRLDFVAGRESGFTAASFSVTLDSSGTGGSDSIDLLTAPMILGNIGGAASPALGGNPFSLSLTGVSAGDTLTVTGAMVDGVVGENPQSAFLDSFALARVPEPTTVALSLIGILGLFGLVRRR